MPDFPRVPRGYDRRAVGELFARIEGTLGRGPLEGPPVTAAEVRAARFAVVFRGYARYAVDEAMAEAVWDLESAEAPDPPPDRRWIAEWVAGARFRIRRLGRMYAIADVDRFLKRVAAGMDGSAAPVPADDLREAVFRPVRVGPGYVEADVDHFLENVAAGMTNASLDEAKRR